MELKAVKNARRMPGEVADKIDKYLQEAKEEKQER